MSFNVHARKVRDAGLPYSHRVSALRSCVQLYRPIGFWASLSFLEASSGSYQRDENALLRALDALSASRAEWHAAMENYAAARKLAKRRGQRTPRPTDHNPNGYPQYWYGAPEQAALHALHLWTRRRGGLPDPADPVVQNLNECVTASLASDGRLTPEQQQLLAACVAELRQRHQSWNSNPMAAQRAWDLLKVSNHLKTAAGLNLPRDQLSAGSNLPT